MAIKIGLVIVALVVVAIAGLFIAAAAKPDTFRVRRTVAINASPEKIFPLMNDFRSFGSWSPYEKRDPTMKRSYDGPSAGKGSIYAWDGNKNVGSGRMEILESTPASKILIKLDFSRPFEAHNLVTLTGDFKQQAIARVKAALYASQQMDHTDIENLFLDTHTRF